VADKDSKLIDIDPSISDDELKSFLVPLAEEIPPLTHPLLYFYMYFASRLVKETDVKYVILTVMEYTQMVQVWDIENNVQKLVKPRDDIYQLMHDLKDEKDAWMLVDGPDFIHNISARSLFIGRTIFFLSSANRTIVVLGGTGTVPLPTGI
jgi:hypothetical protein